MAKKTTPIEPPQSERMTPPAPPVPTTGGSYDLVDGELRKRAPESPQPAQPPANQE